FFVFVGCVCCVFVCGWWGFCVGGWVWCGCWGCWFWWCGWGWGGFVGCCLGGFGCCVVGGVGGFVVLGVGGFGGGCGVVVGVVSFRVGLVVRAVVVFLVGFCGWLEVDLGTRGVSFTDDFLRFLWNTVHISL
ncbi:hypothetical protein, partial [Pseudomonas syringae group genomosp. 7]|uniref:hypothetical protein n=1 Tax=Pseudomonas syringae group genomosp. 7 TaxID=251699 RepID=UPI00376FC3D0